MDGGAGRVVSPIDREHIAAAIEMALAALSHEVTCPIDPCKCGYEEQRARLADALARQRNAMPPMELDDPTPVDS